MSQAEASSAEFTWPTYNEDERNKIKREFNKVKNKVQRTKKYDELMKPILGASSYFQIAWRTIASKQKSNQDETRAYYAKSAILILLTILPPLINTFQSFDKKVEYQYKTCHTFDDSGSPITKGFDGFLPQCELEIQFTKAVDEKVGVYVKKDEEGRCLEFYSTIYEKYGHVGAATTSSTFMIIGLIVALGSLALKMNKMESVCIAFHYNARLLAESKIVANVKFYGTLGILIVGFMIYKFDGYKGYETVGLLITIPEDPLCESLATSTIQDDEDFDLRCVACVDWPDQNLLEFRTEKRDKLGEVFSTLLLCYVWYQVAKSSKGYYGFIDGDAYMMSKEDDLPIYFNIHEMRKRQMTLERAEDHKYWFMQQALAEFSPDEEKTAMMMKAV
eukprot:TRINITY_DN5785_c0_g1_i1.p1 TRINITY_DN5785_c0_g1~~TRINITY_DN5785_c0_g1_i1.p1  ORF type:complete len:390 (-),score=69.49 TRINITY_DN5785_c0_g1_i1:226-1395(-)